MPTIYPASPYFDDFEESKQFYRMLFRPGRAVQARELTQLQTIIQNQIEKFGGHVFKTGSVVTDCPFTLEQDVAYVKINDLDAATQDVDLDLIEESFVLTGVTSGVSGEVYSTAEGLQTSANPKTIFFKYTNAQTSIKTFIDGEQLQVRNTSGSLITTVVAFASNATGLSSRFTVGDGTMFVNGIFLRHNSQSVILSKYSSTPSAKVGVLVTEEIVTSDSDESLLDPALGSSNYFATGADRFKTTTTLVVKDLDSEDEENFYLLFEIQDGVERRSLQDSQYNDLLQTFADRTYEESGNYTVKPFSIRIREHLRTSTNNGMFYAEADPEFVGNITGNASLLLVGVEPGIAYVNGYRVDNKVTEYLAIEKGIDFISEDAQPISFGIGNYVLVTEAVGAWDIDNAVQVSLRDANARAITNETFGATSAPGSQIGTARVRSFVHESGNVGLSDAQYRLYLYDITMDSGKDISDVRAVFYEDSPDTDSLADTVLSANSTIIFENNFNTGLFKFPQRAIKRLTDSSGIVDNSWQVKKNFDINSISSSLGTFSISVSGVEEFPYSAGPLTPTAARENFILVLNEAAETVDLLGNVSVSTTNNVLQGDAHTSFTTQLKAGDRIKTAGGNIYVLANVTSDTVAHIVGNADGNESTVSYNKQFGIGEIIDLGETGSTGNQRYANVISDTEIAVTLQENFTTSITAKLITTVQRTNGNPISKNLEQDVYIKIDCSTHPNTTNGEYSLGISDIYRIKAIYHGTTYSESNTDVTNQFTLDNGQRDNFYINGKITKKPGSSLSLTSSSRLLVKLDYFSHDTTSDKIGYYSFDSYPVDDTEVLADSIRTENVPVYTSPITGLTYDLRDCIDIRPRYQDGATAKATTIAGADVNPTSSTTVQVPSGGLRVPEPNSVFNTDLEYYLSRRDIVYIDKNNFFGVITGVSALYPNLPNEDAVGMTIATVTVPPYPSLTPQTAKNAGRYDYTTVVQLVDNRRYTMKDIGAINQRINRLEYYAALNFLEKDANDTTIASDVTGLDRFKNGFLVDNFRGHGVGNVYDPNYKIAVDPKKGELRPYFKLDNIDLEFNSSESTNVVRSASDATITLTNVSGTFGTGTVTQGSVSGTIRYTLTTVSTGAVKLYVENVTGGSFSEGGTLTSGSASGTIATVTTPTDGDLVTLPYRHVVYARNPFASKPKNLVQENLFNYVGEITLSPPADNWTDTRTNPDLVVNFENNLDNFLVLEEAFGTQWNDWEDFGPGRTISSSTATAGAVSVVGRDVLQNQQNITERIVEQTQTRTGTQLNVIPETVEYNLGNRTVDVSVIPFIRSQVVGFSAIRLKPSTRFYAYFDSEPVSQHCRPVGGSYGDALVTDSEGNLSGQFRIPNDSNQRFRVGARLFRLTDDILDRAGFVTTSASETFTASGILQTQETTILSSRQARLSSTSVSDERDVRTQSVSISNPVERVVGTLPPPDVIVIFQGNDGGGDGGGDGGADPLAQTFSVENSRWGTFITKIDFFFRTKHPTLPVTVQIREVVNGYPGSRILPFGSATVFPDDINLSEDATAPTPFVFPSPVYLANDTEYCFVLLPAGNNPEYNIWVSELGQNEVGTTRRISEQPYVGMLFTSANNRTWTPAQAEDVKFTMYRADFTDSIGTVGEVVLNQDDSDFVVISNLTGGTLDVGDVVSYSGGTGTVKEYDNINNVLVVKKNTSARIKQKLFGSGTINTSTSSNVVSGVGTLFDSEAYANVVIYSQNTNTRIGKVLNIVDDSNVYIDANAPENLTGNSYILYDEIVDTSDASIYATVESLNDKLVNLFHTQIQTLSWIPCEAKWYFKGRNSSSNVIPSYKKFLINENTDTDNEVRIMSDSTEHELVSGVKSLSYKLEMTTRSELVCPVVDLIKPSSIIVQNYINNDATGETANQGNAVARYISRQVTLDEGQDAEDLKVYLTGYKPSGTDIKVYARLLNAVDGSAFNEIDYIEMERVTSAIVISDSRKPTDFKEYEYKMPTSALTGTNGEVQYVSANGNTYTGYKHFAIKIVLTSNNSSLVPRVKDYRAIALQL